LLSSTPSDTVIRRKYTDCETQASIICRHLQTFELLLAGLQQKRLALPCMEAGQFALDCIRSAAALAVKLQHLCVHACAALLSQVAASFFVPFCLSGAAGAARVRVLCGCLLPHYVRVYNALVPIVLVFPAQRGSVSSAMTAGASAPEMIRISWSKGLPKLEQVPFSGGAAAWGELAGKAAEQYGIMQSAGLCKVSAVPTGAALLVRSAHVYSCQAA
jgi:hypothetical protein